MKWDAWSSDWYYCDSNAYYSADPDLLMMPVELGGGQVESRGDGEEAEEDEVSRIRSVAFISFLCSIIDTC